MKGRYAITIADILEQVTEAQILSYYLGITEFKKLVHSPLREDNNASFGLKIIKDSLYYRDFATNEHGNLYELLMHYLKLSYYELLERLYLDLEKIKKSSNNSFALTTRRTKRKGTNIVNNIKVITRAFKNYDIEYWEQYGISKKSLIASNTYPISTLIVEKEGITYNIPADKYAYVYVEFKDNKESLKIYQPFSTQYKWINKHDSSVWDLWNKLPPTGETVIITSSRKDALCIYENTGIPAVSLQAESYLPKLQVINQLKSRFKNIIVLYDNDFKSKTNPGETFATNLANEFQLIKLTLPIELGEKDTSDLCKKYGRIKVAQIIYSLIQEKFNHYGTN